MFEAYIDGACKPVNPGGTASYGVIVYKQVNKKIPSSQLFEIIENIITEKIVWKDCGIVGTGPNMSNNVGGYAALLKLLEWLNKTVSPSKEMEVFSNNRMLVNQMRGEWKAHSDKLYYPYYQKASALMLANKLVGKVIFFWIPRELNLADALTVEALVKAGIVTRR